MKKLLLTLGAIASAATPVAAVVACGITPAATHVDEGFNNASLIEDFNIADEAETSKILNTFSIDGTAFDISSEEGIKDFVGAWVKSVNADSKINKTLEGYVHAPVAEAATVKGDEITVGIYKTVAGKLVEATELGKAEFKIKIDKFGETMTKSLLSIPDYTDGWVKLHNFIAGTSKTTVLPKKNDSIDSILYTLANGITKEVKTDHDKAEIESDKATYTRQLGESFDLIPYAASKIPAQMPLAAEFHEGDKINFIFNDPTDIASFTERVKYVDTNSLGFKMQDKLASSVTYKVTKKEAGKEYEVSAFKGTEKVFTLNPTAKNIVTLKFVKPKMQYDSEQEIGVFLGLVGFSDVNKDGKIDHSDESMSNQFDIDLNRLSSSYTKLVNKDSFISGYDVPKSILDK